MTAPDWIQSTLTIHASLPMVVQLFFKRSKSRAEVKDQHSKMHSINGTFRFWVGLMEMQPLKAAIWFGLINILCLPDAVFVRMLPALRSCGNCCSRSM